MVAASEISEPATANLNISAIAGGGAGGGRALPYVTVSLGKVRCRPSETSALGGEAEVGNAAACHRLVFYFCCGGRWESCCLDVGLVLMLFEFLC